VILWISGFINRDFTTVFRRSQQNLRQERIKLRISRNLNLLRQWKYRYMTKYLKSDSSTLYSGGPWFKSRSGDQQICWKFVVFSVSPNTDRDITTNWPWPFHSLTSFPIIY